MNNLCHALVKTGKFDEVESLANEALKLEQKITGKPAGYCSDALHKALAAVCENHHDYPAAIQHIETAVASATEVFGANHRFTNDKRALLARLQVSAGLLDEAEQTLELARRSGGGESAENSLRIASSALALARGDLATAENDARQELDHLHQSGASLSTEMVDALQTLAAVQFAQGNGSAAEATLREAIAILKPKLNAGMPMLVSLQADLAKVMAGSAAMGQAPAEPD
jgi:hypothetical protein